MFLTENAWPAAANTITDSLTEIGVQNVTALEIFNTIRNVAGIIIDPKKPDPDALASHFHGCLQLETRVPAGEPALRYFRDDFYAWNGRTWQRVDDKELKATVTRHIQQAFRIAITETLIGNVIVNLKGQTLLNAGHFQIPFWIESESPLVTRTPPLVVFQNGIVDIDDGDAIRGRLVAAAALRPRSALLLHGRRCPTTTIQRQPARCGNRPWPRSSRWRATTTTGSPSCRSSWA